MKLYLILLVFSISQLAIGQQLDREVFESTLGKDKAYAYSVLEVSFEEFLKLNYPNGSSLSERVKSYLKDIKNQNINWTFNDSLSISTLEQLEKSGLRRDILLYNNESYKERFDFENYLNKDTSTVEIETGGVDEDFEEIKEIPLTDRKEEKTFRKEELKRQKQRSKFPTPNRNGLFYYALVKAQSNNEDVKLYVSLITKYEESPSPSLIAAAFSENFSSNELIEWENRLIMIVEIYLKSLIYNEIMKE